jgi:glycosyltransferase involved in cell wall biosynthesis
MTTTVRVLQVITRMNFGGPAFELHAVHEYLPPDVQSIIVTGVCERDETEFLSRHNIRAEVQVVESLSRTINLYRDIKAFIAIRSKLQEFQPDVVHTHLSKAGLLARLAALTVRPRPALIHTFHGHVLRGYFGFFKNCTFLLLERFLGKRTNMLFCIGTKTKLDLVRLKIGHPDHMLVIPTGLVVQSSGNRIAVREELNISLENFVIIYPGRLTKVKRIDRLADVMQTLGNFPNLTWLVAGDGEELHFLKDLQKSRDVDLRLLGWRSDLDTIFSACDLSVLVSDHEGTPLSVVHAGLHGVPTLATNVGSVSDLIKDGFTGFLVEPLSQSVVLKLTSILEDKLELKLISERCKKTFRSQYSGQASSDIHAKIYRQFKAG